MPAWLSLTYVTLVGACVGSFLNVVIARLPEEISLVRPRSRCPRCVTPIAWYDNIPLLSYLLLRARCRHCRAPIALRYPLVELLMALLSAALWVQFGWSWGLLLWWPLFAAFLAITFLDIDHWWVPDKITYPAMVFAFVASFAPDGLSPWQALLGLAPTVALAAIAWLYEKIRDREGMGLGDIKLFGVIGLALGWWDAVVVLFLASAQGAVIGIMVTLTGGHQAQEDNEDPDPGAGSDGSGAGQEAGDGTKTANGSGDRSVGEGDPAEDDWEPPKTAVPFGPFLVLATLERVLLPEYFGELFDGLSALLGAWLLSAAGGP